MRSPSWVLSDFGPTSNPEEAEERVFVRWRYNLRAIRGLRRKVEYIKAWPNEDEAHLDDGEHYNGPAFLSELDIAEELLADAERRTAKLSSELDAIARYLETLRQTRGGAGRRGTFAGGPEVEAGQEDIEWEDPRCGRRYGTIKDRPPARLRVMGESQGEPSTATGSGGERARACLLPKAVGAPYWRRSAERYCRRR